MQFAGADRDSFNDVLSGAQTYTTGDYDYTWAPYVSAVVTLNSSTTLHSGDNSDGYGGLASVSWNDAPSSVGTGTYSVSSYHSASSSCGDFTERYWGGSDTANQPTIGNLPSNDYLWYFNTSGAVPAYDGSYYYPYADLVLNKNCGGSDPCSGTAYWSLSSSYMSLSCASCSSTRLSSTGGGTCSYSDGSVSVSLDSWTIGPESIGVASPTTVSSAGYTTNSWSPGYISYVYWNVPCNCSYNLPGAPLREAFGTFQNPNTNNWPNPSATSAATFNINSTTWADSIGISGSYSPQPVYTGDPGSGTTLYRYAPQNWYAGSQSSGGINIFSGWIECYINHGSSHF
jgi:hypothetical protein